MVMCFGGFGSFRERPGGRAAMLASKLSGSPEAHGREAARNAAWFGAFRVPGSYTERHGGRAAMAATKLPGLTEAH